jgi:hypothetical protein
VYASSIPVVPDAPTPLPVLEVSLTAQGHHVEYRRVFDSLVMYHRFLLKKFTAIAGYFQIFF